MQDTGMEKARTKWIQSVWCLCCHVRKSFHSGGSSGAGDNHGMELTHDAKNALLNACSETSRGGLLFGLVGRDQP